MRKKMISMGLLLVLSMPLVMAGGGWQSGGGAASNAGEGLSSVVT
jgi:hypothetical protein